MVVMRVRRSVRRLGRVDAGAAADVSEIELWHRVHDAAIRAGLDSQTAVDWADALHWPREVPCDDEAAWNRCSPFRAVPSRLT